MECQKLTFLQDLSAPTLEIRSYKFYKEFLLEILGLALRSGLAWPQVFKEIKKLLLLDVNFEQNTSKFLQKSVLQIGGSFLLCWTFVGITLFFMEIALTSNIVFFLLGLFLWHLLGLMTYFLGISFLEKRYFSFFGQEIKSLFAFWGLLNLPLPIEEILSLSQLPRLLEHTLTPQEALSKGPLFKRLEFLVFSWKERGQDIKEEIKELLHEWWFFYELQFEQFLNALQALTFGCLVLFFLTSYLAFNFYLFYTLLATHLA